MSGETGEAELSENQRKDVAGGFQWGVGNG